MKRVYEFLCIAIFSVCIFSSCQAAKEFLQGPTLVVTTPDQVYEDRLDETALVPDEVMELLPQEALDKIPEDTHLIVAPLDAIKEDGKALVVLPGDDGGMFPEDIVSTLFSVGSVFVPGLAAWEGLLAFFIKRKRQNYARAAKAVAPEVVSGYPTDWYTFAKSLKAALLGSHSTMEGELALSEEVKPL